MSYYLSVINDDLVSSDKAGILGKVSKVMTCERLESVAKALTIYHTTAATFVDRIRKKVNLKEIQFLQYDFDDGTEWHSLMPWIGDFNHIIVASKNHMLPKGDDGIKPRFHLYIELDKPITDPSFYSYANKFIAKAMKLTTYDRNCTDCTRYFFKGREVLQVNSKGKPLNVDSLYALQKEEEEASAREFERWKEANKDIDGLDLFKKHHYYKKLCKGILGTPGSRHWYLAPIIYAMQKCGVPHWEALALISANSIWGNTYNIDAVKRRIRQIYNIRN